MDVVTLVAAVLLAVLIVFQAALALGAPWGVVAYGGVCPGVLPRGFRINSLVFAAAIYPVVTLYVLDAGGAVAVDWLPGSRPVVLGILSGFFGLGALANAFSRSRPERWWAPVAATLSVCCAVLA